MPIMENHTSKVQFNKHTCYGAGLYAGFVVRPASWKDLFALPCALNKGQFHYAPFKTKCGGCRNHCLPVHLPRLCLEDIF